MHKVISTYYQKLIKTGFEHIGKIDNADIFLKLSERSALSVKP